MKKLIVTQLLMFFLVMALFAQNYNHREFDKWIFGKGTGLDFSTSPPTVINSAINAWDMTASISDGAGNLLFYTEGKHVYNRIGALMPNGSDLLGDTSGGQTATIVRKPGSANCYYVFTNPGFADPRGFRYTVVDMALDGGMGDVDTSLKNILVFTPYSEQVCPVLHADGYDVWIIVHEWQTNVFRSYLLTDAGLTNAYVRSQIGVTVGGDFNNAIGQLVANNDGDKLATGTFQDGEIELFNFNRDSGTLNNAIVLPGHYSSTGYQFSPDGSKLYVTLLTDTSLLQFDLSDYSQDAIANSVLSVGNIPAVWNYHGGYMQTGPDNKIYVVQTFSNKIGVINDPNVTGRGCNYDANGINLGSKTVAVGLPDMIVVTPLKNATSLRFTNYCESGTSVNVGFATAVPNPFSTVTHFSVKASEKSFCFELYDYSGELIRQMNLIDIKEFEFQRNALAAGVYIYRITSESIRPIYGKLVIE